ncbi:unnamed protein product, partial [Closterium sp. NIES-65]
YLGFNNLTGPIPDSISVLSSLYTLTLQSNQLSGSIPSGFSALRKINMLWIADNSLSGPLPEFLGALNATVQLLLDGNAFEGQLPAAICNLTALEAIGLSNNHLYGSFPTCLFNFPALNYVDMSNNSFYGPINMDFVGMVPKVEQPYSLIPLSLPPSFPNPLLPRSDMSNNSFYGPINMDFVGMVPKPTSGYTKPAVINLAHNYFYGDPIVYAGGFKACPTPRITRINMSDLNSLGDSAGGSKRSESDSALEAVQCVAAYATVQASYKGNCLSVNRQVKCAVTEVQRGAEECAAFCSVTDLGPCNGRGACVPPEQGTSGGAFKCSHCESHLPPGNRSALLALRLLNPLTSFTLPHPSCPHLGALTLPCPTATSSSIPMIAIVGLSCLLGIALLASVLCLLLRPKKKKRWSDLDVCQQFSIATMRKATNDWAEENVLGEGGFAINVLGERGFAVVYKGVNPATGQLWAVKRIILMSVSPISFSHQFPPSVSPISFPHQFLPSVSPISFPHQFPPSVSPISFPHQFPPSVSPISFSHQFPPSVSPISFSHQLLPSASPISFPHQFPPSVFPISFPHQFLPSVSPISFPHQFPPSVSPMASLHHARQPGAAAGLLSQHGYEEWQAGADPLILSCLFLNPRACALTHVRAMASLHHANLVRLLGFCHDMDMESGKQEQILVYEFVEHGDLSFHLFKTQKPLTLRQRLKLAVGAAEGLAYLHGFENPIIHRDIKPANILVGDNLTAKVADFGLLRKLKFGEGEGRATKVAGTPGYVDPDYNRTELVTTKSDVYSFGVVLLEMLSGRRVTVEGGTHIGKWATTLVQSYSLEELKDRRMDASEDAVVELADLALDCIKMPGIRRPEMKDVVRRLDAMLTVHTVEEEDENVVGDLFSAFSVGSAGEAGSAGIGGSAGTFGSTTTGGSATTIGSAGVPVSGSNATGAPSQRDERYSEIVVEREDEFKRHSVESASQSYISSLGQSVSRPVLAVSLPPHTLPAATRCCRNAPRGQITNRLLCLRNHMLLAGLLNRTLLIPFHRSETILNYDLHLVLDLAYLRSCIGPTVFTTAEFRRKFRRPVQVSQVVCWHGPPGACADQVDNILLHCPGLDEMRRDDGSGSGGNDDAAAADGAAVGDGDAAGDDGDNGAAGGMASDGGSGMAAGTPGVVFDTRVPVSHSLFRSPLVHLPPNTTTHAACLPMLASPQQVLRAWGSNPSPVLVVGDLLNLHVSHAHEGTLTGGATHEPPAQVEENMDGETPQQSPADGTTTTITAQQQPFLDLPFRRSAACPSPLLLRPRPALLESAELLVGRLFGGRPFLALHWRRGDFKPWCFWRGPKHACFYPVHQVAHWVVERVRESGIQELFLATNAKLKECHFIADQSPEACMALP